MPATVQDIPDGPLLLIWRRFAPYHVARIEAARDRFGREQVEVVGLEVTALPEISGSAARYQDPDAEQAQLDHRQTMLVVERVLDDVQPCAVAVPGWRFAEARAALRWCRRQQRPSILMSDSKQDDQKRYAVKELVKRHVVSQCAAALVAGAPQREYLQSLGFAADRIHDGYDVVDNVHFSAGADSARSDAAATRSRLGLPARYFLCCARITDIKNLERLLDGFNAYRQRAGADRDLVLCGDGPLRDDLARHVRAIGAKGVCFAGRVEYADLPAYYGLASAMILASRNETWGLVVNEGMAAGLPVCVSANCGCVSDLVQNGRNGVVFDPESAHDIAEALHTVASLTSAEREDMGKRSRQIIANWGLDRFATGLWNAYRTARDEDPSRH